MTEELYRTNGSEIYSPVRLSYWDAVISLGGSCQVAEQLNRLHLRDASYPFDWLFSTEAEYVIEALKNRFEGFLEAENLTESPTVTGHRKLTDNRYHMVHQHIFPLDVPWEKSYAAVKETVDRRVRRLLSWCQAHRNPQDESWKYIETGGYKILFIRTNTSVEQSERLSALLSEQFGESAFLLVVNHTHNFQIRRILSKSRVQLYEIYDESNGKLGDRWQGYNPHWDRLLSSVRLWTVSPFQDDSLFQDFSAANGTAGSVCSAGQRKPLYSVWKTTEAIYARWNGNL